MEGKYKWLTVRLAGALLLAAAMVLVQLLVPAQGQQVAAHLLPVALLLAGAPSRRR